MSEVPLKRHVDGRHRTPHTLHSGVFHLGLVLVAQPPLIDVRGTELDPQIAGKLAHLPEYVTLVAQNQGHDPSL